VEFYPTLVRAKQSNAWQLCFDGSAIKDFGKDNRKNKFEIVIKNNIIFIRRVCEGIKI
jgi:hypothetical protein